jgi:hypothetical protein
MGKRTQNFLMLLVIVMVTGGLLPPAAAQSSPDSSGPDTSCETIRQERQELCDEAARQCIEVYQYDAFNKIVTCADLSQRCSQAGREEAEVCTVLESSQMSAQGPGANRVANPGKTL